MKKFFVFFLLSAILGINKAYAGFDRTNIENLGKHFKTCSPYRSPEYPNGKNGIALQQILGTAGDKCHYQEYGFFGPDRKKITHDCYFTQDDLKILGTLSMKNHAQILIQYLNDPYTCKVKRD